MYLLSHYAHVTHITHILRIFSTRTCLRIKDIRTCREKNRNKNREKKKRVFILDIKICLKHS